VAVVETFDELPGEFLGYAVKVEIPNQPMNQELKNAFAFSPTLTINGPRPSDIPTVSMYFFRSRSRNSNTR
jgi:hypothetical protein